MCARVVGTGIDHRDLVDADEVGVRARTGHGARVVGARRGARAATARSGPRASCSVASGWARHAPSSTRCHPGNAMRCPPSVGARAAARPTRRASRRPGPRRARSAAVANRARSSRFLRVGKMRSTSPRSPAASASTGRIQADAISSRVVVEVLALGRGGEEEPGVVAARAAGRRDPVRHREQLVGGEDEIVRARTSVSKSCSPAFNAARASARCSWRPSASDAVRVAGEQHARLLEGLAHGGDEEPESAVRRARAPWSRAGVVPARARARSDRGCRSSASTAPPGTPRRRRSTPSRGCAGA